MVKLVQKKSQRSRILRGLKGSWNEVIYGHKTPPFHRGWREVHWIFSGQNLFAGIWTRITLYLLRVIYSLLCKIVQGRRKARIRSSRMCSKQYIVFIGNRVLFFYLFKFTSSWNFMPDKLWSSVLFQLRNV